MKNPLLMLNDNKESIMMGSLETKQPRPRAAVETDARPKDGREAMGPRGLC